jgi:drug/metabolite transporter (DMT)-like permease
MSGPLLSILSGAFFGLSAIFTRRGVLKASDSSPAVIISVFLPTPLFGLILLGTGQASEIGFFSTQSLLALAAAGVLNFIVGRGLYYTGIWIVGANMANILINSSPLYSVLAGILIFHEPLTLKVVSGSTLVIAGVLLLVWGPSDLPMAQGPSRSRFLKGVFSAVAGGLAYGLTPIFVKWGLAGGGNPVAGAFISYVAALAIMLGMLSASTTQRRALSRMGKEALMWFCAGSSLVGTAQLLRYLALSLSPMSIVAPLMAVSPLFTLFFSFIINRNLETFNARVILGAVCVVAGTVILFGF